MEASWNCLPDDRRSGKNALLRAFLAKLPIEIKDEQKDLENELVRPETLGTALPWTFDQLIRLVAQYMVLATRRSGATEQPKTCAQAGAAEATAAEAECLAARACPCCGKTGHTAKECKVQCKKCKEKSYPGARGEKCVMMDKNKPPESPIPTAIEGVSVPGFVVRNMVKKHAKLHKLDTKEVAYRKRGGSSSGHFRCKKSLETGY